MSVVAFGKNQMSADRAAFNGSRVHEVEKLVCVKAHIGAYHNKFLIGGAGSLAAVLEFREWITNGAIRSEFPASCRGDEGGTHLVYQVGRGPLLCYGGGPIPWTILEPNHTIGEGNAASYVLGYMDASGVSPAKAMKAVIDSGRFDSVGFGVDAFDTTTGERVRA